MGDGGSCRYEETLRRGTAGNLHPVLLGTGIRIQTIIMVAEHLTIAEIAEDYDLTEEQVKDTQIFYEIYRDEMDASIQDEAQMQHGIADS